MRRIGWGWRLALLSMLLVAQRGWAEQEAQATGPMASGTQLLSVLFSLFFVLGLILVLAWVLRRFGQGGFSGQQGMKVVASLSLGTRERLLVVDIQGQQLLLGVTPQQIRTLHVFDEPVIDTRADPKSGDFRQKLLALMHNKQNRE